MKDKPIERKNNPEERLDETTLWKRITRNELYEKFPYLENLSIKDMIQLISMCFSTKSDGDLIYYIKCYMHSYPELQRKENFEKIFSKQENEMTKNNPDELCSEC